MRPLLIDPDVQEKIDAAVKAARAKPTPWEVLAPHALGDVGTTLKLSDRKPGNEKLMHELITRSTWVDIPVGFHAAISFEQQPAGLCRHLSISVEASAYGKTPNPMAFEAIARAFGFRLGSTPSRVWVEEFRPGEHAVNIIELEPTT